MTSSGSLKHRHTNESGPAPSVAEVPKASAEALPESSDGEATAEMGRCSSTMGVERQRYMA
jgi:hypothetical protein